MASLTIRNIDNGLKERLRVRAAVRGHSMEEEARIILRQAVTGISGAALWEKSRALFSGDQGVELEPVSRADDRPAPDLGGTDTGR